MRKRKERKGIEGRPETLNPNPIKEEGENEMKGKEGKGFFACYLLTSLCPRYKGQTYVGFVSFSIAYPRCSILMSYSFCFFEFLFRFYFTVHLLSHMIF